MDILKKYPNHLRIQDYSVQAVLDLIKGNPKLSQELLCFSIPTGTLPGKRDIEHSRQLTTEEQW